MKEGVISQGFVRTFKGTWLSLTEVPAFFIILDDEDHKYYITAGTLGMRISSGLDSQSEAQAWMDYMMLQ